MSKSVSREGGRWLCYDAPVDPAIDFAELKLSTHLERDRGHPVQKQIVEPHSEKKVLLKLVNVNEQKAPGERRDVRIVAAAPPLLAEQRQSTSANTHGALRRAEGAGHYVRISCLP